MRDLKAYELDPTLRTLKTQVLTVGREGERSYAVLADTVCYPEGGGQPGDRGVLNGVAVLDTQKRNGEIRHLLEAPVEPGEATLTLDWARRFDHMQQHTGQHLLTAVAQDRFRWATTAFHLGPEVCDIELEAPSPSPKDLERLEEAVAEEIRAARPVAARWVTLEGYGAEKVRSRGLPEGHVGDIRLVEIAGVDLNTCGGTHLAHTGQIEALVLLGTEPIRGGVRLFYVAGGRARHRLRTHEARNATFRTLLGAPDAELAATLQAKLDQVATLEKRTRRLEEDLAEQLAVALALSSEALVEAHCEEKDMAFLQKLARNVLSRDPAKAIFLTGGGAGQGVFLLSAGEACALDVPTRGRAVAEALGAKGGGNGRNFQGKAPDLSRRVEALMALRG